MSDAGECIDCGRTMDLHGVSDPEPDDFVCYECDRDRAVERAEKADARVRELEARAEAARKLQCFADHPVCMCCVEMIGVLFPEPLAEHEVFVAASPPASVGETDPTTGECLQDCDALGIECPNKTSTPGESHDGVEKPGVPFAGPVRPGGEAGKEGPSFRGGQDIPPHPNGPDQPDSASAGRPEQTSAPFGVFQGAMTDYVECGEAQPLPGPSCQREKGHAGDHQACDEDAVLSTWPRPSESCPVSWEDAQRAETARVPSSDRGCCETAYAEGRAQANEFMRELLVLRTVAREAQLYFEACTAHEDKDWAWFASEGHASVSVHYDRLVAALAMVTGGTGER